MARRVVPMKSHTFRISDEEWQAAVAASDYHNEDLSEVIRRDLRAYVALAQRMQDEGQPPAEPVLRP